MPAPDVTFQVSTKIAAAAAPRVGFDPLTIISILLPLLAQCFQQQTQRQTAAEYLRDHFDEDDDSFDQSLINRCRPQTRRAAREAGQPRLKREQLDTITEASLREAMNAPAGDVSAVFIESL